jgi:hypothetical protein
MRGLKLLLTAFVAITSGHSERAHSDSDWQVADAGSGASRQVTTAGLPIPISTELTTAAGSIVFWVNPDFGPEDPDSHTFLSARWSGADDSYLVISDGWWEPAGAGLLYFVLSNEDQLHCTTRYDLPRSEWSMIAVTWSAGRCEIYVDAMPRISVTKSSPKPRRLVRMSLGADAATTIVRQRVAPGKYAHLRVYDVALDATQLAGIFERDRLAEVTASDADWRWLDRYLADHPRPVQTALQRNVIFDETEHWGTSRAETDTRLARIARAGFNAYVPTLWYGRGTFYDSTLVHRDPATHATIRTDDPLTYLIQQAHARAIEVHGSFTIAQRTDDRLVKFFGEGVPPKAYDVHNPEFRAFIANVVGDAAQRYALDGVNLDYIRAIGICTSPSCRRAYAETTGRNLAVDYVVRFTNDQAGRAIAGWQQDAVRDIVVQIRKRLDALHRPITLSVCFNSVEDTPYSLEGRDATRWINEGLVDLGFDMQYEKRLDVATIDRTRSRLASPERYAVLLANWDRADGKVTARTPARMTQLAEFALRQWPQSGFALYLYNLLDDAQIDALRRVLEAHNQPAAPAQSLGERHR